MDDFVRRCGHMPDRGLEVGFPHVHGSGSGFGTLKRGRGFFRARYFGLSKVKLEFSLKGMFQFEEGSPYVRLLRRPAFVGWQMPSTDENILELEKIDRDCRLATRKNGASTNVRELCSNLIV